MGYDVNPRDVEDVIYEHPGVTEVVVIGIDSLDHEKTIKAYIVLEEGWTRHGGGNNPVLPGSACKITKSAEGVVGIPEKPAQTIAGGRSYARVLIEEEKQRLKNNGRGSYIKGMLLKPASKKPRLKSRSTPGREKGARRPTGG